MSIIDLVFCCIRGLLIPLAIFGMTRIDPADPMYQTGFFEILTLAAIAGFGIPGHALILMRKPIGVILVWLAILATLGNIGVALWQVGYMYVDFAPGTPERVGAYVGAGVVSLIRVALCVMVAIALFKFSAWHRSQSSY